MMASGDQENEPVDPVLSNSGDPGALTSSFERMIAQTKVFARGTGGSNSLWRWDHNQYSARRGPAGIEIYDIYTGEIVRVQLGVASLPKSFEDLAKGAVPVTIGGRTVYVDPQISLENLEARLNTHVPFSPILCELICEKLAEGLTPPEVAELAGMPTTTTMRRWRKQHPEFEEMWRMALQDYADMKAREALDTAREVHLGGDPDAVGGGKLFVDTLKWAAEKADPDKFGSRMKVSGEVKHAVALMVDTGIRRVGDTGFTAPVISHGQRVAEEKEQGLLPDIVVEPRDPPPSDQVTPNPVLKAGDETVVPVSVSHVEEDLEETEF